MVKNYSMHLAGHCKVYSENINSPSKVTLRQVLSKPSTSPATLAEVKATHQLVQGQSSASAAKMITVFSGVGGQVRVNKFLKLNMYNTSFSAYYLGTSLSSSSW